jgi:hypothetical protein
MHRKLELFSQVFGEARYGFGLGAFLPAHAQGVANDDLANLILPDNLREALKIKAFVLSLKSVQTLGRNPERIRDGQPDSSGANVESENAGGSWSVGRFRHERIIFRAQAEELLG